MGKFLLLVNILGSFWLLVNILGSFWLLEWMLLYGKLWWYIYANFQHFNALLFLVNLECILHFVKFWADGYANVAHHMIIKKLMLKQTKYIASENKTVVLAVNRHQLQVFKTSP